LTSRRKDWHSCYLRGGTGESAVTAPDNGLDDHTPTEISTTFVERTSSRSASLRLGTATLRTSAQTTVPISQEQMNPSQRDPTSSSTTRRPRKAPTFHALPAPHEMECAQHELAARREPYCSRRDGSDDQLSATGGGA